MYSSDYGNSDDDAYYSGQSTSDQESEGDDTTEMQSNAKGTAVAAALRAYGAIYAALFEQHSDWKVAADEFER